MSFVQTVIPRENNVDGFVLTHTQSPEIINFDIIFALSEIAPRFRATPLCHIEKIISLNSILGMLPITLRTQ